MRNIWTYVFVVAFLGCCGKGDESSGHRRNFVEETQDRSGLMVRLYLPHESYKYSMRGKKAIVQVVVSNKTQKRLLFSKADLNFISIRQIDGPLDYSMSYHFSSRIPGWLLAPGEQRSFKWDITNNFTELLNGPEYKFVAGRYWVAFGYAGREYSASSNLLEIVVE